MREKFYVTIPFSLFLAENIYKQYSHWCNCRYLGSKQPILLVLLFSLMLLILITCIPAWAIVILRLQNVFCFKTWFQIMILWLISSWVVIFYFWFLSKEEACQSALKQLNYFWVKTTYRKIPSQNIKILLVFNRCYLGRPVYYHSVNMITVWGSVENTEMSFLLGILFFQFFNKAGDVHLKSVMVERYVKQGEQWNTWSSGQL